MTVVRVPRGSIADPACAASHDVMIGGKTVGKIDGKRPVIDSVFVTSTAGACYRYADIAYGDTLHGSAETFFRGEQVYRFPGEVQYFLQEAPESVRTSAKSGGIRQTQIQKITCP